MHAAYFRPGGVHQDLPERLIEDIGKWIDSFLQTVENLDDLLTPKRIFKQRNVDIGAVPLNAAWGLGFSGVMVRGSGAARDLRRSQPYECHAEMVFDVPIGENVNCYGRYLICMEEMHQSDRIMRQCVDLLLGKEEVGPVSAADGKVVPPKRAAMKRAMEAPIHHFKLYAERYRVPAGEVYAAVQVPKGEFGFYLHLRRHHQTISLQAARAWFRGFPGDGHPVQGPHAGRRVRRPRLP
jgi:NADH-quinone oxidoreductase subunit D